MTNYDDKCSRKDTIVLRTFFDIKDAQDSIEHAIKNYEVTKFKPLQNFLNGKIAEPSSVTVELLAWLINFEGRPFDSRKTYGEIRVNEDSDAAEREQTEPSEPISDTEPISSEQENIPEVPTNETIEKVEPPKPEQTIPENPAPIPAPSRKRPLPKIILGIFALALVSIAGYWLVKKRPSKNNVPAIQTVFTRIGACMYWNGDHYEQIACVPAHGDTLVVALDSARFLHFRKIMLPDTITAKDIGKIWYLKLNGNIEFYTAEGFHPIETTRMLKPLTAYIFKKYIHPAN